MEPLYNRESYQGIRENLGKREAELIAKIKENLGSSHLGAQLFEFLVIRRERRKEKLCKELDLSEQGKASELADIIKVLYEKSVDST